MVKAFAERSNALQEKQRQEQALKAAELKKREEEKTDYESFCASLATKKKTPAISFSVGSDGRPVSTPRMQYEATAARAPSSDNNNLSNLTRAAPVGQRPRPSKVLKRVTHRLYSDGSESIHVEFILDKMLIEQATRDKERYLRLLQSKNLELDDTEDKPSIAEDSEEELEDSVEKKERLAVKIGRLKEAVRIIVNCSKRYRAH